MEGNNGTFASEVPTKEMSCIDSLNSSDSIYFQEKGVTDIESWKTIVSSRMDALARENSMLRSASCLNCDLLIHIFPVQINLFSFLHTVLMFG